MAIARCPKCPQFHQISRQGPRAFFLSNRFSGDPLSFSFRNRSTRAVSYLWNFGDDSDPTYKTDRNIAQHTFPAGSPIDEVDDEAAFYNVILTATFPGGTTDSYSKLVNIREITSDFTYLASGLSVQFTDTSNLRFTASKFLWEFEDGTESAEQNPLHRFPTVFFDTIYFVSFTIFDAAGNSNTVTKQVLILGPPNLVAANNRVFENGENAILENGSNRVWEGLIVPAPGPVPVDQFYLSTLTGGELEDLDRLEVEILAGEP